MSRKLETNPIPTRSENPSVFLSDSKHTNNITLSTSYTLTAEPNPGNSLNSCDKEGAMEEESKLALEVEQSLADGSDNCEKESLNGECVMRD